MRSFFINLKKELSLTFVVETILVILFYLAALYLAGGNVLFGSEPNSPLPVPLLITAIVVEVISISAIFIYEIKTNKYRPNLIFISILSVLFIIQIITILTFQNGRTYSVTISNGDLYSFELSIGGLDYFRYIIGFLSLLLIALFTIDFIPKKYKESDLFVTAFCLLMIIIGLVSFIASLFLEADKISGLFHLEAFSDLPKYAFMSFYPSKNAYALVLICAELSLIYLCIKEFKIYLVIAMIFVQIPIILSQSKLCIAIGLLALIGYGIIKFLQTYKDNKKRNWIVLGSIIGALILISIILFVIPKTNEAIKGFIENIFYEKFGKSTMDGRVKIWEYSFVEMSYFNYFTGAGYKIFNLILAKFNCADVAYYVTFDTDSPHNAFIQILGNGGIALLIVFIALFALVIYLLIKTFKNNHWLSVFECITLASILALSMLEDGTIFFPQTGEYLFLTCLFAVPIISNYYQIKAE